MCPLLRSRRSPAPTPPAPARYEGGGILSTMNARQVVQAAVSIQAVALGLGVLSWLGALGAHSRPGVWFIFILDMFGALRYLAGAGALHGFGPDCLAALAGAQLDAGRDAYYIGLVFNGLGSALFAWVLFQSRYIPRALALWGVLSAVYEGFCGFAYLLYPRFGVIHSANWYELPPITFDLLLCFWLLFRRLKSPETVLASPSAA